jgi:hypothetical protein
MVQKFLQKHLNKVFVILDESSWIKTTQAMPEHKKSGRCRLIKLLNRYSSARCGLTGTYITKSPINAIDQNQFLSASIFDENEQYSLQEKHCIMMTLRTQRGRRVPISQKEWHKQRKRMIRAYKLGGEEQLAGAKERINRELGITYPQMEHILVNRTFNPFINIDKLMKRTAGHVFTVERKDIFDISYDKKVYDPIIRRVKIGKVAKELGNQFVKLGFTDKLTLGKAPAMELVLRLQDVCNGMEPIEVGVDKKGKRIIEYKPLKENPKLDELMELLDEIDLNKEQVVVFTSRANTYQPIADALDAAEISHVMFTGEQTDKEKKEAEEKGASGEARVVVINQGAGAYGLNWMAKFNYLVWFCSNDNVEEHIQAMHRILRGQSKNPKFAYVICVENSVEEKIMANLVAGKELLGAVNNKELFVFK